MRPARGPALPSGSSGLRRHRNRRDRCRDARSCAVADRTQLRCRRRSPVWAYRQGDPDPIVTAFSQAAFAAIGNGEVLIGDLRRIRDDWAARVQARSHASVWRALPLVMSQPAVTVNHMADRLGISKPAAQTAIEQMVAAHVLAPANNFRRNRVWVAGEVVEVLDDFAERAGRRRFAAD